MTAFTETWDASFEALPPNNESAKIGAQRIRDFKRDVRERIAVDHSIAGDANDGKHTQVTLRVASGDPTLDTGDGCLYTKTSGTDNELFFKDSSGNIQRITGLGTLNAPPSGSVLAFAGAAAPGGWLLCYGQAVSRTTYASLFTAISTVYGVGDGSTTFNLPDLRGRSVFGQDNMGGSAASRITNGNSGIVGTTLGAAGGDERVQTHKHTLTDPGHTHTLQATTTSGGGTVATAGNNIATPISPINSATTGITMADYGAGSSGNVPPAMIMNFIIKT